MKFKKANKILYNSKYDVQSKYVIWLPDWFGGHLGFGKIIDQILSYDVQTIACHKKVIFKIFSNIYTKLNGRNINKFD